jgi:hypothetical protein
VTVTICHCGTTPGYWISLPSSSPLDLYVAPGLNVTLCASAEICPIVNQQNVQVSPFPSSCIEADLYRLEKTEVLCRHLRCRAKPWKKQSTCGLLSSNGCADYGAGHRSPPLPAWDSSIMDSRAYQRHPGTSGSGLTNVTVKWG